MRAWRTVVAAGLMGVSIAAWSIGVSAQSGNLPLGPVGSKGEALFPYLEGWFENPDGTFSILFGYYNRNSKQSFDIPVGANNRFEPGNADQGQPTHFRPERNNRMFTVTVPKDYGNRRMTWTITVNGITQAVTAWLDPEYFVEPLLNSGTGNTPPVIRIADGPERAGPSSGIAKTYEAVVGEPLTLSVWASDKGATIVLDPNPPQRGGTARGRGADDAAAAGRGGGGGRGRGAAPAAVTLAWAKYRGTGDVKFSEETVRIANAAGETGTTTATFAQPGEYWLRVMATEGASEGGSGQCCSSSAIVRVNVKAR
jgi:hypothetical protein